MNSRSRIDWTRKPRRRRPTLVAIERKKTRAGGGVKEAFVGVFSYVDTSG